MVEFHFSLLRERIGIFEENTKNAPPVYICSNRMPFVLTSGDAQMSEAFVVRAQTMHLCARMAAAILREFQIRGFLAHRFMSHQWHALWQDILSPYDIAHNPHKWVKIYHKGICIFENGEASSLIDTIESAHYADKNSSYDKVLWHLEESFARSGKSIRTDYDANTGLVSYLTPAQGRCALILRGPGRTATFRFIAQPRAGDKKINMYACLSGAAAFLEGVQLSFIVGTTLANLKIGLLPTDDKKAHYVQDIRRHILTLNAEIDMMEDTMAIWYRPERPDFQNLIIDMQEQNLRRLQAKKKKTETVV